MHYSVWNQKRWHLQRSKQETTSNWFVWKTLVWWLLWKMSLSLQISEKQIVAAKCGSILFPEQQQLFDIFFWEVCQDNRILSGLHRIGTIGRIWRLRWTIPWNICIRSERCLQHSIAVNVFLEGHLKTPTNSFFIFKKSGKIANLRTLIQKLQSFSKLANFFGGNFEFWLTKSYEQHKY